MFILMTDDGRYITPSRKPSSNPEEAALFCQQDMARNLVNLHTPSVSVRQLVPAAKCPDGKPFGGGLVVQP